MVSASQDETIQSLRIDQEIFIHAPIDIAFEAMLEVLSSGLPDGTPMQMVLEAFPGGRWYRDLGNQAGHLWGHVQVIKPPTLLEITGPLFMSYPCANHVLYRFAAEGTGTKVTLTHRGFGEIPADHKVGVQGGWRRGLERIKEVSESRALSKQ